MEFYDAVKARVSTRSYKSTPVPQISLDRIAEAVSLAPSACNRQPWKFLIIKNPLLKTAAGSVYRGEWLKDAPLLAVIAGNTAEAWKRLEGKSIIETDTAIAMEHFVLAAANEGLSTCWICAFETAKMDEVLGLKTPWSAYAITPLGYATAPVERPARKKISDIFQIIE